MNNRTSKWTRSLFLVSAFFVGSACILESVAGPTPTPKVVVISGDGGTATQDLAAPTSTPETVLSLTPTWTLTPQPTNTATTAPVTMTAGQALSCVKGPHWILYEWVAGIAEGETVTLLAKATPEWEEYYFVRKSNGTECWAFGGSSTKSGDLSTLPVREAPPLPVVTYQIENKTGLVVSKVFIRGKNEAVWGINRLGTGVIMPGQTANVTLTAGFYDVRILESKADEVLYEEHDRAIGFDPAYRYTELFIEVDVFVNNDLGVNVCSMSYRKTGEADWRVLHSIEDGVVAPGAGDTVRLVVGMYDFRWVRCGGAPSQATGISILPSTTRYPS
jgi:hypothetical protein